MAGLTGPVIDFGLLIIGAMVLGGVALFFRQPVILAYIAAGILLGGEGFGLIHDQEYLYAISSELGIAMLLFVVGLELSIKKMLEVRNVVTFGVIAQSLIFVIVGMFAGYGIGFTLMESVYLGLVMAFASTLLIVKMLGEKHMIDTLPGRIMVGSLVFEDILVIVTISILGVLAGVAPTGFVEWFINLPGVALVPYIQNIALVIGAILLLLAAYLINQFIARPLIRYFAESPEMLFVSALGFCFAIAFLAAELGFSVAIGAFLAGIIVANTDYYLDVLGRVKTLAVFFSLLFFATLGFKVTFENFTSLLIPVVVLTLIVMFVKPLVVGFMARLFGYDKTTAISVGLHMSQISEFGLILITFGIKFGHVREQILTIVILVLLLTFLTSTYYGKYSAQITRWLQHRFRSLAPDADTIPEVAIEHASAVVYGVEHIDEQFLAQVKKAKPGVIVVDPDPESVDYVRKENLPVIVGSLGNEEVLEKLPVEKLELVIVTVPDFEQSLFFLDHFRKHNTHATVILSTQSMHEALDLYHHGASYVHVASFVEDAVVQHILAGLGHDKLGATRQAHIQRLTKIVARASHAVDIDEFMERVTQKQLPKAAKDLSERAAKAIDGVVDGVVKGKKR
jgi:Kef-type K+ transport system membrane component KefB